LLEKLNKTKRDCSGCTACVSICANNAVQMIEDKEGFLYPEINKALCVDCGKCENVCPFYEYTKVEGNFDEPKVYAVKNVDENERMNSQSGGAFAALSDYVLEQSGVVYGAAFAKNFYVYHKRAVNKDQRDEFRGSKYVQSDLGNVFIQIKDDLKNNKTVFFSGTPCQVAGLKSFLTDEPFIDNLITCDLICHGVPSQKVWQDFLSFVKKRKGKMQNVNFRNKKLYGWRSSTTTYQIKDKVYSTSLFNKLFFSHYITRPACAMCKYKNLNRIGEISIGDFWGIEKTMPDFEDNKGVSLLLVNNVKGMKVFNYVKHNFIVRQSTTKNCLQRCLQKNWTEPSNRSEFWKDYYKKSFNFLFAKYLNYPTKTLILKHKIKQIIKKVLFK